MLNYPRRSGAAGDTLSPGPQLPVPGAPGPAAAGAAPGDGQPTRGRRGPSAKKSVCVCDVHCLGVFSKAWESGPSRSAGRGTAGTARAAPAAPRSGQPAPARRGGERHRVPAGRWPKPGSCRRFLLSLSLSLLHFPFPFSILHFPFSIFSFSFLYFPTSPSPLPRTLLLHVTMCCPTRVPVLVPPPRASTCRSPPLPGNGRCWPTGGGMLGTRVGTRGVVGQACLTSLRIEGGRGGKARGGQRGVAGASCMQG